MSFGFKYGVPLDADFVFDMRFLPNPFWVPELQAAHRRATQPVADCVLAQEGATEFLDRVVDADGAGHRGLPARGPPLRRPSPIGCTGGKHRSVAMTEAARRPAAPPTGVATFVVHRDLGRE